MQDSCDYGHKISLRQSLKSLVTVLDCGYSTQEIKLSPLRSTNFYRAFLLSTFIHQADSLVLVSGNYLLLSSYSRLLIYYHIVSFPHYYALSLTLPSIRRLSSADYPQHIFVSDYLNPRRAHREACSASHLWELRIRKEKSDKVQIIS